MSEFDGPAEISKTNFLAINEDAEKLWNYILSYRNRLFNTPPELGIENPLENDISIGVIPLEEVVSASEKSRE